MSLPRQDLPEFGPHLGRLQRIWVRKPLYFITTCTHGRQRLLADPAIAECLRKEWFAAEARHGWRMGRYVIMPDHVHFFASPLAEAKALGDFIGRWKEWTAKIILRTIVGTSPFWQHRFFDHVLRSQHSYAEKWEYVLQNPIRAGLAKAPGDWPYSGHIHFDDPI